MGRLVHLGALACLYLGAESKALRWQDDTPSWVPPKQTIAAMNMEELGFSPRPTTAPDPANVELKLAKRVRGDDTCGYISGESTNSIYCEVGTCVINSFYSVVGCCASSALTDCRIATSCLPSSSSRLYTSGDTLMRFCSASAQPECITYVYSGAIVGGVVGGVAAIALIVFGIIFLRRKKKKDAAANNTNSQAAPATYNGPPPPQQGQPQMYQQPMAPPTQQSSPGGYAPPPHPSQDSTYPQGFAPVDNRQSMLKQPYDVTTGSYEQTGVSPPASPPPLSPSPTYQSGVPQYVATQNAVSPTYPPPQQQQQQHQGSYYNAPPPPAQGQPAHPQQQYQQPGFTSELPTHRGDNELRELA
ncbi:hypothetical protein CH063_06809 [Colletotrichum higginsianum]|uniref:Uncharacterized protein n=1 Tax=Colletotrichum higginsianum (strain IMI 349063) TaxID=759273 RepID=H1V3V2_COLHI|nr:hypothetical protein CH063_06809 [Colletotrichum higginsianum]